jgi:hypothetical protein
MAHRQAGAACAPACVHDLHACSSRLGSSLQVTVPLRYILTTMHFIMSMAIYVGRDDLANAIAADASVLSYTKNT